jgi:hypothetical protein
VAVVVLFVFVMAKNRLNQWSVTIMQLKDNSTVKKDWGATPSLKCGDKFLMRLPSETACSQGFLFSPFYFFFSPFYIAGRSHLMRFHLL